MAGSLNSKNFYLSLNQELSSVGGGGSMLSGIKEVRAVSIQKRVTTWDSFDFKTDQNGNLIANTQSVAGKKIKGWEIFFSKLIVPDGVKNDDVCCWISYYSYRQEAENKASAIANFQFPRDFAASPFNASHSLFPEKGILIEDSRAVGIIRGCLAPVDPETPGLLLYAPNAYQALFRLTGYFEV